MVFIVLSSRSLSHSSVAVNLLLIPSRVFFISIIVSLMLIASFFVFFLLFLKV